MAYIEHKSEESMEDYLETILILETHQATVRAVDIANELNYSKPSVSVAMKNLRARGYISDSDDGYIHLTEEGRALATQTYERHTLVRDWLISLGVPPKIAATDSCHMEHDMAPETFEAIKKHILACACTFNQECPWPSGNIK